MAHNKLVLTAAFVAVASSATLGGAVFAHEEGRKHAHTTNAVVDDAKLTDTQKQRIEERKTEIKQRVEAKRAEASAKLADKRLAACEKRQVKVNSIFTKATERNKKHLAVFQKIEERVKAYYVDRGGSRRRLRKPWPRKTIIIPLFDCQPIIPSSRSARRQAAARRAGQGGPQARAPTARRVLDRTEHGGTLLQIETS